MRSLAHKSILVFLLLSPNLLWAEELNLLVALHIQAYKIDLEYPESIRKTDFNSFDLIWHEHLNNWLDGSIKMGILGVSQGSNPIPEGQSSSGEYLGLGLRFQLYPGTDLKLFADLDYQFSSTRSDTTTQKVESSWHQVSAQLQAEIRLFEYTYLTLAGGTLSIDGDEDATGTTTAVVTFKNAKSEFGRLGFKIGVDPSSHIGIEIVKGSMEGGRIYFSRWF